MTQIPMFCPICEGKNEGRWQYLCPKCWINYCVWVRKKHSNIPDIVQYLPEYITNCKVRVQFT